MKKRMEFERLRIRFVGKLREDWIGDWDTDKSAVYIHKDLSNLDRLGVMVHEFVELFASLAMGIPDCCDPSYRERKHGAKNELAHILGNSVERRIMQLSGHSWRAHQRRCRRLSRAIRKKTAEKP